MRFLVVFLALVWASVARAQTVQALPPVAIERIETDPLGTGSLTLDSARLGPATSGRVGAGFSWERTPVVLRTDGGLQAAVVRHRTTIRLEGGITLLPWLAVTALVPLQLSQAGDDLSRFGDGRVSEGAALLAPELGLRFGLLQQSWGQALDLAIHARVVLPIGPENGFGRDSTVSGEGQLLASRAFGPVLLSGEAGVAARPSEVLLGRRDGSRFVAGIGLSSLGTLRGELTGRASVPFSGETLSSEVLGGLRWVTHTGLELWAIAGPGLSHGLGTPSFRALGGLAFSAPSRRSEPAPAAPPAAAAPIAVATPFVEHVAEPPAPICTASQVVESGRCVERDTDGDGVPDAVDNCVRQPGPKDNQGCPKDDPQSVVIRSHRLEILDQVRFATGSAVILPESDRLLRQVARVLLGHPEIAHVTVEGHTDATGPRARNLPLSNARARAVSEALVRNGVAPDRLSYQGIGPDRPVETNATPAGRRANRRVEFVLSEPPPSTTTMSPAKDPLP